MDGRDLVRSVKAIGSAAVQGLRTVRAAWRQAACRRRGAAGAGRGAGAGARAGERCGAAARRRDRPVRPVRAAGPGRGGRRGLLGLGRGRAGAVVRARGPLPGAGSAGRAGAGQGRRLAGGVGAGDGGGVAARGRGGAYARRGGAAPGSAAALVGAGAAAGAARWVQRSEVAADARFFGLGGRASGPRLRDGTYRLWNTDPGRRVRARRRSAVPHDAGAAGGGRRGHASGVPRQLVGRHG